MNRANMSVRSVSAVDALNACILMLRLESKRYNKFRDEVWSAETPLTPKGMQLMEEAYKDVNMHQYSCEVNEMDNSYECMVSRLAANSNMYSVTIPKESTYGSRFGTCNCGIPQRDGKPCVHMIVLAKGGHINDPGITRLSVMLHHWYSTLTWQNQFPKEIICRGDVSIKSVKCKYKADDTVRYCPDWAAP